MFKKTMEKRGYYQGQRNINNKAARCWIGLRLLPKEINENDFFSV